MWLHILWREGINTEVHLRNQSHLYSMHSLLLPLQKHIDFCWKPLRASSNCITLGSCISMGNMTLKSGLVRTKLILLEPVNRSKINEFLQRKSQWNWKSSLLTIKTSIHCALELVPMCIFSFKADHSLREDYFFPTWEMRKLKHIERLRWIAQGQTASKQWNLDSNQAFHLQSSCS